jgi:hypothetical protein
VTKLSSARSRRAGASRHSPCRRKGMTWPSSSSRTKEGRDIPSTSAASCGVATAVIGVRSAARSGASTRAKGRSMLGARCPLRRDPQHSAICLLDLGGAPYQVRDVVGFGVEEAAGQGIRPSRRQE